MYDEAENASDYAYYPIAFDELFVIYVTCTYKYTNIGGRLGDVVTLLDYDNQKFLANLDNSYNTGYPDTIYGLFIGR